MPAPLKSTSSRSRPAKNDSTSSGLGQVGLLAVEPDHLGARVGERRRDGAADPAGRAGDDCNLP